MYATSWRIMRADWTCADLRKSKANAFWNTLLLLLIVVSYVPQICLILNHRSISGITQSYIMFGYLFTATQFTMVLLYSYPIIGCIADQKLRGQDAYGAILGLIQMTILWIAATLILVFFFLYPNEMHVHRGDNEAPFAINSTVPSDKETRYPRTILSLCILHTCIWVLPAVVISILHPSMDHPFHPAGIFMGFCDFFLIRACIVLVTCIFPLQISEIIFSRRPIYESSLSPTTLALQMVAFILLGLSSKRNLGQPGDPWNITPPGHISFETRYRMGAWQWVNSMIFGFGQGLLLLIYLWVKSLQWTSRGRIQNVDEATALL